MNLELDGHIVLVTGSSRGLGRGLAASFLTEGATVILTGRDPHDLKAAAEHFRQRYGPGRVRAFLGDLGQQNLIDELARFVDQEFGQLNHLVCNIGSGRSVPPLKENAAEWQRMLEVNLLAAVSGVRGLLPLLQKSAAPADDATSITFISSICGVEPLGCPVAYAAAKSALISYAQNIARPLGPQGIRVNVVSPGNIIFPGSTWEDKLAKDQQAVEAMLKREVPLQRLGTVAEVANVVLFLASSRAAFVTGANWVVDGGQTRL
ncbi:MAG: SDR family oxidoreductase [Desulfobaccales bacterium]|nr:SDR family oxidoreductase [Desulfobaccales bacterium]